MNIDAILKSDVLDIIFENRNKTYGAYTLRKFYNNRLYTALGAMFGVVVVFCAFSFIAKEKKVIEASPYVMGPTLSEPPKNKKVPEKPQDLKKQPIPAAVKPLPPSVNFTAPVITTKTNVPTITTLDPGIQISDIDKRGKPGISIPIITKLGTDSISTPETPKKTEIDKITPIGVAEVMPSYPGGMAALIEFLKKNLKAPEDVNEGEIVSVKIKFVVGYDGVLKSFETVEDGGRAFNNEVIRVLKKMPEWIPGKTKGENVSVYYTIPVKFTPTE